MTVTASPSSDWTGVGEDGQEMIGAPGSTGVDTIGLSPQAERRDAPASAMTTRQREMEMRGKLSP
jgi:hypothetical protein